MKRVLLAKPPQDLPAEFARLACGAPVYDSSCSPEARVWFIDRDQGYYLKRGEAGKLKREALMTEYFHSKGLGTEVLRYFREGDHDWMLTAKVEGEDCTHARYLENPKRLCDTLASLLRSLHDVDHRDCPVVNRLEEYLATAERNYREDRYDRSHFPDSFGYRSGEEAYAALQAGKEGLRSDVLLHGDYCLPNVMLADWRFSAFIDVDGGGVGDRHIDLFWGAWTLFFNLKTDAYRERFLDAYGRDRVDEELLRTVAAAEVFG